MDYINIVTFEKSCQLIIVRLLLAKAFDSDIFYYYNQVKMPPPAPEAALERGPKGPDQKAARLTSVAHTFRP